MKTANRFDQINVSKTAFSKPYIGWDIDKEIAKRARRSINKKICELIMKNLKTEQYQSNQKNYLSIKPIALP